MSATVGGPHPELASSDATQPGVVESVQATAAAVASLLSEWFALADLEARDAVFRVLFALSMAIVAVILTAAAWLFAASSGVAALVTAGFGLAGALLVVAVANLLLGGLAVWLLWRSLRRPWFEATRRQLTRALPHREAADDPALTH